MGRIVVGVDGSTPSEAALRWAADEARLRGDVLVPVCVFSRPAGWLGMGETMGAPIMVEVSDDDLTAFARQTLDKALETLGDTGGLEIEPTVVEGRAAGALTHVSADADLLVVGNRGHGDVSSLLLGSVGMHCVHHAPCPVVVVRLPDEGRRQHHGK